MQLSAVELQQLLQEALQVAQDTEQSNIMLRKMKEGASATLENQAVSAWPSTCHCRPA